MSELFAPLPAFSETDVFPEIDGVTIKELEGIGLATVMARKGQQTALADKVRSLFGLDLPSSPVRSGTSDLAFVGTGPGIWLAVAPSSIGFATRLAHDLDGLASVSDQSSGYVVLRLSGPRAHEVLQRGLAIDLHKEVFPVGSAAASIIAHIGVVVWRTGKDAYEVAFFRSMAGSFRHWLAATMVS